MDETVHQYKEEEEEEEEEEKEEGKKKIDEVSCQASVILVLPPAVLALPHVVNRISEHSMTMEEAIMEAARTGDVKWLEVLVEDGCYNVYDAAVVGARNDDVAVVDCLLRSIDEPFRRNVVAWAALEAAAEYGHASVVALASPVERIDLWVFPMVTLAKDRCNGLSVAVRNGHADVVELLLGPYEYHWDIGKALDDAITADMKTIVEMIYHAYPERVVEDEDESGLPFSLLADAAAGGHMNAVKYILERGHDSIEEENRAFISVASGNHTETMTFFRDRGRISTESLNQVFERAAEMGSAKAVRFLYEKERISHESIVMGFKQAACYSSYRLPHCGGMHIGREREEVMRFMGNNGLVSPDLFSEVFLSAASCDQGHVLESLHAVQVIPVQLATLALMEAAEHCRLSTLRYLCGTQPWSREVLLSALSCTTDDMTERILRGRLDVSHFVSWIGG